MIYRLKCIKLKFIRSVDIWFVIFNIFCNRSHVQAQPDSSAAFLQEYSHFCGHNGPHIRWISMAIFSIY